MQSSGGALIVSPKKAQHFVCFSTDITYLRLPKYIDKRQGINGDQLSPVEYYSLFIGKNTFITLGSNLVSGAGCA